MYYFYWVPIGTEASVRRTPYATIALLVANVAGWLWFSFGSAPVDLFYALAFKPGNPTLLSLVTSSFLHANLLHLAGNMVFLAALGPALESRIGPARFLLAYIGCSGLGDLSHATWVLTRQPELAAAPVVGASAGISGLLGLILVRLYFVRIKFASVTMLLLQGVVRPARFSLPAAVAVALWFLLDLVYLAVDQSSHVATMAHLSACGFGIALGFLMGLHAEARLERLVVRGNRYAEQAEWFAALGEYDAYLQRRPDSAEVLAQAARVHRVTQQEPRALERFRASVHASLAAGDVRAASEIYEEMRRLLGDATLHAADLLRLARGLEEAGRPADASRVYEAFGRQYPDRPGAAAALLKSAAIEERRLNNPGRARFLYQELMARALPLALEEVVRARARGAEEALARQLRAGSSALPTP